MRHQCPRCTLKHLGQAWVLLIEASQDTRYAHHAVLAVGHLAEAEQECMIILPEVAHHIRRLRLRLLRQMEDGRYHIPLDRFIKRILPFLNAKEVSHV